MDIALAKNEVVDELWLEYKKSKEYKSGLKEAITVHHIIVEKREKDGLRSIYKYFVEELRNNPDSFDLEERKVGEWLEEWKNMHHMLFRHILKKCGNWREIEVRFGSPGDEDLYRIPKSHDVPRLVNALADKINHLLNSELENNEQKYQALAQIHYEFVRIHPFADGNGRIARAITDQLAIHFGFPPAMAGYPRHDKKRRESYHKAIRSCVDDSTCQNLANWIGSYIEKQLEMLA